MLRQRYKNFGNDSVSDPRVKRKFLNRHPNKGQYHCSISCSGYRQLHRMTFKVTGTEVGVENYDDDQVMVWPDPTTGVVRISATDPVTQVDVYNVQGMLMMRVRGESTLDLGNLSSGVYMLRIQTENAVSMKRVVLQ